jgi:hypothetical protein
VQPEALAKDPVPGLIAVYLAFRRKQMLIQCTLGFVPIIGAIVRVCLDQALIERFQREAKALRSEARGASTPS